MRDYIEAMVEICSPRRDKQLHRVEGEWDQWHIFHRRRIRSAGTEIVIRNHPYKLIRHPDPALLILARKSRNLAMFGSNYIIKRKDLERLPGFENIEILESA